MRHGLMPVAFFFAEHKEMLHRLSAGVCLSRASAAKRQAKNNRKYSNARHSKPPRYRRRYFLCPQQRMAFSKSFDQPVETKPREKMGRKVAATKSKARCRAEAATLKGNGKTPAGR